MVNDENVPKEHNSPLMHMVESFVDISHGIVQWL